MHSMFFLSQMIYYVLNYIFNILIIFQNLIVMEKLMILIF